MRFNEKHGQNYAKEWVEYFAKFGTQHLTPKAQFMPLWQRVDLDIKAVIYIMVTACIVAVWIILEKLYGCIFKKATNP